MNIFNGLNSFEVMLLILGVLFFLTLVLAFIVFVKRGRPFGKLFPFFAIPILMIGFPSIKSIEFSKDMIKIEKYTRALEQNPTDKNLRDALASRLASVSGRPSVNPNVATTIARAQIVLGDNAAAEANVQKALQAAPQLSAALELKKRIELDRNLATLTAQAQQDPNNVAVRAELQRTVTEATRQPIASPVTLINLAAAQVVIGDHAQARSNVDKALKIDPNSSAAKAVSNQIRATVIHPQ